jgi:hypothetical protein
MGLFRSHDDKLLWSLTKAVDRRGRPAARTATQPALIEPWAWAWRPQPAEVALTFVGFRVRDAGDLVIRAS